MTDVFVVAAARTAIGSFGGWLKGVTLTEPRRAGHPRCDRAVWPCRVGYRPRRLRSGHSDRPRDAYLARVAAINAGVPHEVPAMTVNRLCGSGLQDALALTIHQRAAHAIKERRFAEQIVPVEIRARGTTTVFDTDEYVRPDVTAQKLGALKPVFRRDGDTVTAGNASGINDGAAAICSGERGRRGGTPPRPPCQLPPAGVDPAYMRIGPVPATLAALRRAGLRVEDLDD